MSISASQIVNVVPRVINAGGTDLEITGLLLTTNSLCVFPGAMSFSNASSVGAYFGLTSAEYQAAQSYFLGYDNSFTKPQKISFARLVTDAIAASLIGGQAGTMEELKAVSAGGFTISINGSPVTVSELDLSEANTQSDVANTLQQQLSGTTVSYNSNLNAFIVTSGTTGATSSITVATDGAQNVATLLGLTASSGATVSNGSDELTPSANMDSITSNTQNWVSFTTMEQPEDAVIEEFAQWANNSNGEYLYCPYTANTDDTTPSSSGNLPNTLATSNYEGVLLTFGGLNYALLAMAIGASIDWNRNNGLVTWAFKTQSGLEASVNDDTTATNCVDLNVNFYGNYATRNDQFLYYYQGAMIGGSFGFVDAYIGNLWLRNALQVSIVNGFGQIGRVPYTETGYTTIRAWCMDPINRALNNGVIDAGVTLSEAQKAQLIQEIGEDVSNQINTDGYYLMISDPGAQARVERDTPTLGLWYTYGGSVHRVELPVTAIL